jgi:peptide/nickel transport system substrate-binding protein
VPRCPQLAIALVLTCALAVAPAAAQDWGTSRPAPAPATAAAATLPGTIVVGTAVYGTLPIPTLMEGSAANTSNFELADQLFLRLAVPGPALTTAGDRGFEPQLARSWTRRDSLTLVFELDPRARWHDGTPVTARDVVFTFERARDAKRASRTARPLQYVSAVEAEGDGRVVVRFSRAYAEQLYDATFHVQPLPYHLVGRMSPDELRASSFVRAPVGNGPYRWGRAVPGQYVELVAVPDFFLGRPGIGRLVFRVASSPEARLNLLLSGELDAVDAVVPPLSNLDRVRERGDLRTVAVPSTTLGYLLFNQRDPADPSRPHPILADSNVRRAIVLALDRERMARSAYGPYARVPVGPVSQVLWIRDVAGRAAKPDVARARRLLAASGWRDADDDGTLERGGRPLVLALQYPTQSAVRRQLALQAQAQLARVGVRIELAGIDGPVWIERRTKGAFDIDFSSASQDPTPSGLVQSWSCAGIGGSNVARYCEPAVDSLLARAIFSTDDPSPHWRAALRRIEADAPAAFLYAAVLPYVVHRRFEDVRIRPEAPWLSLWQWRIRPGAELPRDRVPGR